MSKPNFVVFLTDDQGYGDLSCMGATDFRTPSLDRLAGDGVRFTNCYANSSVCSPSRASLLTGRYPGNAGVRSILAGHRKASGLPQHVPTLATALKENGYSTHMIGKWHLGLQSGNRPEDHGFDYSFAFLAGCIDYYSHIFYWGMNNPGPGRNPTHDLWENGKEVYANGEYFTELITKKAIERLRAAKAEGKPFLLYVPYNAPHYPMHAPQKYLDRFPDLPWDRQIMAAMLSAVDDSVGAIMDEVERLGFADDTCTFFTADNGPSRESRNWLDGRQDYYYGGKTGALKGHKFSLYEGGIRVPGIMHWPGTIEPGQVSSTPVVGMDIFPTFLGAAGGDVSAYEIDGVDLLPHLTQGEELPEREIYWELNGQLAVRKGKWKFVSKGQLVEGDKPVVDLHLANLDEDMCETTNLIESEPDIATELQKKAEAWIAGIKNRWETEFNPGENKARSTT